MWRGLVIVALCLSRLVLSADIGVIGSGFSGLAAALEAASLGHKVTVYESNSAPGGRAQVLEAEGFSFDMGPSWYWMPEIYDKIFERYGFKVKDYYSLKRLDPAYRVYFPDEAIDVPGDLNGFLNLVQKREPTAVKPLETFFKEAEVKYDKGLYEWVWKPHTSLTEVFDFGLMKAAASMDMFGALDEHVHKFTQNKKIRTLLEWPVMFIGLSPHNSPSLYSLMTYAGHAGGTFYPEGGMHTPAAALSQIAKKMGVTFEFNSTVDSFVFDGDRVDKVCIDQRDAQEQHVKSCRRHDGVISAGDYHFVEQKLLPRHLRRYTAQHWEEQVLSPSVILFYLGFDKPLPKLLHHTLFFDDGLEETQRTVFEDHTLTKKPAFYVSATSKTDPKVAPPGGEAVFVLVPVSYELIEKDTPVLRKKLKEHVLDRMEEKLGYNLRGSIVYQSDYGPKDFKQQFHAFKGNAFGHANLLSQSLALKPSMDSLVPNMVFAGHLTHPGPGVPPALVSGNVAAGLLHQKLHPTHSLVGSFFGVLAWIFWWSCAVVVLVAAVARCFSKVRSLVRCVDLMFRHGKTYYAASTLMEWEQYLDTCCLYAIFREADDIVDCFAPPALKRKQLDDFMGRFYLRRETGALAPDDPVIFEASIECIRKYEYPERLWEAFFRSMASDISTNVCRTMDDTMLYMDGSAAVLGEFMLPLLGPDAEMSPAEKEIARPHARDLGLAFQLTNMIRDIGEDLHLGRQYIPVEVCEEYQVDLAARDASQPRFQELIEAMMEHTDTFYASADVGIEMLPVRVRDSIRAARQMYCKIHDKIRAAQYNIYRKERIKVSGKEKLKIAAQFLQKRKITKMVLMDRASWFLLELFYQSIPACLVLYGAMLSCLFDAQISYESFLLVWIVVPIAALGGYCVCNVPRGPLGGVEGTGSLTWTAAPWIALLCAVATAWTTPWDNYLVWSGVWGYGTSRIVLGTIGYVPVAEYLFFSLETILCCLVWLTVFNQRDPLQWPPKSQLRSHWRGTGLTALILMFLFGWACTHEPKLEYLGLILVWAALPLMVQWAFGAEALLAHGKCVAISIFWSTLFLCIADQWAMHHGIWAISQKHSLPLLIQDLPLEEVLFFFLTATLCNFGLTLAMIVTHCGFRFRDVIDWGHLAAEKELAPPHAAAMEERSKKAISLPLNAVVLVLLGAKSALSLEVPQSMEILIMLISTVVIGFPHGALDPLLIHQNFSSERERWMYWVQYFGLYAVMAALWFVTPEFALFVFLVMTVYHFGEGDAQSNPQALGWVEIVARGGSFLVTIYAHHAEVAEIFVLIVGGTTETSVRHVLMACSAMQIVYVVCTVSLVVYLVSSLHLGSSRKLLMEVVAINLLYYIAPPLLAFAVYFNFYHSQRHVVRVMRMSTWQASRGCTGAVVVVFTLLSTVVLGLWYWGLQLTTDKVIADAKPILRPMFIVISVLTMPHMVLVHQVVTMAPAEKLKLGEHEGMEEHEMETLTKKPTSPGRGLMRKTSLHDLEKGFAEKGC